MNVDTGIALGIVSMAGAVTIWAVRSVTGLEGRISLSVSELAGRMNLSEERYRNLSGVVDGIKQEVATGIKEIRDDNKEFRAEMKRTTGEFRTETNADLHYIKGRVDKISLAMGNPRLRRENPDDHVSNDD